jgi:hypothetical protein
VIIQAYALMEESYIGPDEAPPPLGKNWGRRWLQRHPECRRVKAKPMEVQRKLAQEPEVLHRWFKLLKSFIQNLGIQPRDLYNMDEIGCQLESQQASTCTLKMGAKSSSQMPTVVSLSPLWSV